MKKLLLLFSMLSCWASVWAQKPNVAPAATVSASSCNTGVCTDFNDLDYGSCGTQDVWVSTSTPPSSVIGTNYIEWNWPTTQSFDELSIHNGYNDRRYLTGFLIQTWDGSQWVSGPSFTGLPDTCINTVTFSRITTDRMRITSFEMTGIGQQSNPSFREIEILQASTSPNDMGVVLANQLQGVCPASIPVEVTVQNFGLNRVDSVMVNWSVDGVLQTPVKYVGLLDTISGSLPWTASVTLGNYTFSPNQTYALRSWTTLPNNAADTSNFNDTLNTTLSLGALSGLNASNVGATTALVSWDGFGGTSFDIEWGPVGFTQGTGTHVTALDTFETVTGFTPLTSYDIYVATNCGGSPAVTSLYAGPITITTGCSGPVNGTYTLNPGLPYSATNFTSFTQLALALDICGVTGPVTVNVSPGLTFYEQITFPEVSGASATNTITINGNGSTVSYLSTSTTDRATMTLMGTDYMTIDSLNVTAQGSATGEYGMTLRLTDSADYNVIRNCIFTADTVSTSSNFGNFAINGVNSTSTTSSSGPSGDYNLVEGNTMIGGYYALVANGQSIDSANGNIIRNNVIQDHRYYGMYVYYNDGMTIEGNDISRPNRTSLTTTYAMYVNGFSGGQIIKNKVHNLFATNPSLTSSSYGIRLGALGGSSGSRNLVANNMVYDMYSGGTIYGYYFSTVGYTDFVHNSLIINDQVTTGSGSTRGIYAIGTYDNCNIQNNLFYLNRSTSGAKHMIYMSGTLTNSKLDNNSYYSDPSMTSYSFGYLGGTINDFNAWKASTAQDSNSFDINPFLVDVANGDFTPQSAVLDGLGANFSALVSTDITGATRGTPSDPGALEFTGAACTGPSGLTTGTVTSTSATINWNTNTSPFTVEWGPVGFKQASITGTIINVPTGTSTATMTGMSANTCYDYYITQNCSSSIPGAPPVIGPITVCTQCATPGLSGTYTIGGTAGPTNFATLDSAVSVLNSCGILAPVVFNMQGGTHNAVSITNVSGASATNTITFNGSANMGDSIVASSQTAAVELDGAGHVIFNDIYMENAGGNFVVWMHSSAEDISIMNCELVGSRTTSTSTTAVVAASNLATSAASYGNNVNDFTISGCKIVGNYYGVSLNGISTTSKISGLYVLDNDFEDQFYYGVRTYYTDTVEIRGNSIPAFRNTSSYGFYIWYTDFVQVTENSAYAGTYGIYSYYTNREATSAASASTFANNMLLGEGTYGMYMYGNKYTNLYHNTIVTNGTYSLYINGSGTLGTTSSDNLDVRNNIIVNNSTGDAFYAPQEVFGTFTLDNNLYFTNGSDIASYDGTAYTTLAAWQAADLTKNVNSVSGDPQLVGANDFHALGGLANDAGDNTVGILVDIDNDVRPASGSTIVDIGADEYTPVADDIAIINGEFSKVSKCLNATDSIVLDIQNVIGTTKNFATTSLTASWDVTGPINSSGTITVNSGTLAPLDTLRLIGTPVDLSTPGVYTLNAYISPNAENLATINDTLVSSVSFTVYDDWDVQPDSVIVISNTIDTVVLDAKSPFLSGSSFMFTEIRHFDATGAGTVPSYLVPVDDYIEITGVPGSDLDGLTLEIYEGTTGTLRVNYTFPPGTLIGPNGTAIIMQGQDAVASQPSNFMYDGRGTSTYGFSSGTDAGYVLKDGSTIIDAVTYDAFTFPASAGVSSADWSGQILGTSGTAGIRLTGVDDNTSSNWIVVSSTTTQDAQVVNSGVTVPAAAATAGFDWKLNGVTIDTLPQTVVGPYTTGGVFEYVATFNGPCGLQSDTVTVIVNLPGGGCLIPTNLSGSAPACDSVVVNWNSAVDSALVSYVVSGGTVGAGNLVIGDSTYSATGLNPNTNYDFYVANICGSDTTMWTGPYTINSGTAGAPVASFTGNAQNLFGLTYDFDASATTGNGNIYAWDFGDGNVDTGMVVSNPYTTGGAYTVTLIVTNACGSDTLEITYADISLEENVLSQNLKLYPNPAKDVLNVELSLEGISEVSVRILDMSGKEVLAISNEKKGKLMTESIDISNLAKGVYMIEVSAEQVKTVRRLVKE